jgi:hypothetical protein
MTSRDDVAHGPPRTWQYKMWDGSLLIWVQGWVRVRVKMSTNGNLQQIRTAHRGSDCGPFFSRSQQCGRRVDSFVSHSPSDSSIVHHHHHRKAFAFVFHRTISTNMSRQQQEQHQHHPQQGTVNSTLFDLDDAFFGTNEEIGQQGEVNFKDQCEKTSCPVRFPQRQRRQLQHHHQEEESPPPPTFPWSTPLL